MATIVNARDVLLQATSPRIAIPPIKIDQVEGLPAALKRLTITSSASTFAGTGAGVSPATITLTANRFGGLTNPVVWSLISGGATVVPSGDSLVITGSTVTTQTLVLRARVTEDFTNYDAQITITKLGATSLSDQINLATQVSNKLANSNVDGLGALALINSANINTQTFGSLAIDRLGVGTLAAGVIYAGNINVSQLIGEVIIGKSVAGGNYLLLGTNSSTTAPVRFFLNTDGVPANGATGLVRGSFTVNSLNAENNLIVDNSGARFQAGASGTSSLTSPRSGGGTNSVTVSQSGGVVISGGTTITGNDVDIVGGNINFTGSFGGTLGSRIILKNVLYNVEVNGTPGTTVKFV